MQTIPLTDRLAAVIFYFGGSKNMETKTVYITNTTDKSKKHVL